MPTTKVPSKIAFPRINRTTYIFGMILNAILFVSYLLIDRYFFTNFEPHNLRLALVLTVLILCYLLVPSILIIKRLHDINNTAWLTLLYFLNLVSFVGVLGLSKIGIDAGFLILFYIGGLVELVFALYVIFAKGTGGNNKYGALPKKGINWSELFIFSGNKKVTKALLTILVLVFVAGLLMFSSRTEGPLEIIPLTPSPIK